MKQRNIKQKERWVNLLVFAGLACIITLIYSNTFQASWHLDDRPNIVNNTYLHLTALNSESLVKTFYTNPHNPERLSKKPYRPIAFLTFALNWYWGQDQVFGYHLVNTTIHILTAFFLYLVIVNLFQTPNLKNRNYQHIVFISFLAALLWAVNPIQTQAVTYIIQRMAQLAALFYIIGLYAYIKARLSVTVSGSLIGVALCVVCFLLGIYSKPNAAMMPLAVVLIEIIFFQNLDDKKTRRQAFWVLAGTVVVVFLLGSVLFLKGAPLSFVNGYRMRTFTLAERLLTQPRVVLFYLFLIFYPTPNRLSIAHDVVLSRSLFSPWTTLPGILLVALLIGFALSQMRKRPVFSFSIIFFFLNHVVESSVIALEIVFEHRNYLPSFFLFLPFACLIDHAWRLSKNNGNKTVYGAVPVVMIVVAALFSVGTYVRNQTWQDDISLWLDAVSKAPNNARALNTLAINMAWGDASKHPNRYDMALKLFEDSLGKDMPSLYVKADIYGNMALIYFYEKNDPLRAFDAFQKALEVHPGNLKIRHDLASALTLDKNFDGALKEVDILLSKSPNNGRYHNLKGHILLWQGKYAPALESLKAAYELLINKGSVVLNIAVTLDLAGRHDKAEPLLLQAIKSWPQEMPLYFALIENSLRAGQTDQARAYAAEMFRQFDGQQIQKGMETYADNPKYAPISRNLIVPVLSNME